MTRLELSDIKDEIVQDDKLLLSLLDLHLELLICHDINWLIERDWLLAKEALMPGLQNGKENNKDC